MDEPRAASRGAALRGEIGENHVGVAVLLLGLGLAFASLAAKPGKRFRRRD